MELTIVRTKLLKANCTQEVIENVLNTTLANINALTYANESIENLVIYVVLKNTGGYKLFKTINGNIVAEKLDTSYSESRELVCISGWNVKGAYKITFNTSKGVYMQDIEPKEMHSTLFQYIEPTSIKYVIGVEEGNTPVTLSVNCDMYIGLSYKEFKDVVISAYKHCLHKRGGKESFENEPSYYVVSYGIE
jgi:hypothetical protein